MKIVLDPTHAKFTSLEVEGRICKFDHTKRDCGANLIQKLASLKVSEKDELAVIVGPGNFTAVRTACLIANAIHLQTNCQLTARKKDDVKFKKVQHVQPFYASEPAITIAKK